MHQVSQQVAEPLADPGLLMPHVSPSLPSPVVFKLICESLGIPRDCECQKVHLVNKRYSIQFLVKMEKKKKEKCVLYFYLKPDEHFSQPNTSLLVLYFSLPSKTKT